MRYLTKSEIAEFLHVSVRTITSYMANDLLPQPRRLGRRLLWDEGAFHRFMDGSSLLTESRTATSLQAEPQLAPLRKPGRPRKLVNLQV